MITPGHVARPDRAVRRAWPRGATHLLLKAAIHTDDALALAAARDWLATHDIDDAPFRDHRLLTAIVARFGRALADHPAYPRLVGLQRMLWTRGRMTLREARPPLAEMIAAGLPVMLLKGAARIAAWPGDAKARASWDIDLLVRPGDMDTALDVLTRHGWTPSTGESPLALAARLPFARAVNLFFGRFGDLDLHQRALPEGIDDPDAEAAIRDRAVPADLDGLSVRIPDTTDRLALAILSSGREAHAHSDWLVDCARLVQREPIDWQSLSAMMTRHGAAIPAEVALGYLRDGLGLTLPAIPGIDGAARAAGPIRRTGELLEARPRAEWTGATRILRGLAKSARLRRTTRGAPALPRLRGRLRKTGDTAPRMALSAPVPQAGRPLILRFRATGLRRRYEFELNAPGRHLLRLTVRDLVGRSGWVEARFDCAGAPTPPGAWIEARPGRALRDDDPDALRDRYAAAHFALV